MSLDLSVLMPFARGFGVSLGLIATIGAQNAYLLTRGIRRNHHWPVAMLGSVLDVALIFAGIYGMGELVKRYPNLVLLMTMFGAIFLLVYGFMSFRRAFKESRLTVSSDRVSLQTAMLTMLAITLLNPHVYLDTMVLIGSIAMNESVDNRLVFGFGAATASILWFQTLALGGQWLQNWFQTALAWRILDFSVAIMMWSVALTLILSRFA